MAKGARKKTKWVLLTTTVPPTEKEADTSSKLPWETKPRTAVPSSDDCNTNTTQNPEYNVQNQRPTEEQQDQDRGTTNSSSFSNGYRTSSSHHYPPSHHRNYSRAHHHYSGSNRKSHHGGSYYRSSSSSTVEVRNEQTSSVTINEDEYTKITTPRQDVLFKKGYLSRPKKHLSTTTSENGMAVNGSSTTTTTDGSDIATGSGSVSTAESVTSDSTYLTDGLLMDSYPTPYPYYGYIDQSGVLVMNGFAVDSNGYSYMNGGQTYIYPPNYNLSQSQTFEGEEGSQAGGDVQQTDSSETELPGNGVLLDEGDASANEGSEQTKADGLEDKTVEEDSLDQQMTPQQFLAPYANGYDYAQFYNNFYYPGCVMAPFPVVDNGLYYDQFETPSDNQFDFKKYRKWPRNWEEYPVQIPGDTMTEETYQDPSFVCTSQAEEPVTITTEVPVNATQLEQTQAAVSTVPSTSTVLRPAVNSHKASSQQPLPKSQQSKSVETRSQQQPNHAINATKPKTAQKIRKKDLIESTRAFAEQNIDLSRPTYLQQALRHHEESTTWRTVCNGKEVAIEEDRTVESKPKMEVIQEAPETAVAFEPVKAEETKPIESKAGKKESKRGKKTAKGKGKKQKRQNVAHQQTGFEVIEPEFTAVSRTVASPVVEDEPSDVEQDQEDVIEEVVESAMLNDDDSQTVIEAEADEDLEQMLQDVQLTDIHVEEESVTVSGEDHVEETECLVVETAETVQKVIDSDQPQVIEDHVVLTSVVDELPEPVYNEEPTPAVCENTSTPFDNKDNSCGTCVSPISCSVDVGDKEEEIEDLRHFSGEEDCEHVDSGVQSPAAFISSAVAVIDEKKERSYSGSGLHVTDAVTKWLSETLSSTTRLEEMFVLPENPALLHRIQQFHVLNFEDSLAFSSDTYSSSSGSSGDEADDADSDYMSDVQVKAQKTESQKDQLAKQTANGQPHHQPMIGDHSNCKQKRCIIM
uniref:Putative serine/threonine-protein kinase kinx n=1 Tax=Culex tarsalis TaxID=7177 RepID=A0A1Q3FQH4_CULTA